MCSMENIVTKTASTLCGDLTTCGDLFPMGTIRVTSDTHNSNIIFMSNKLK